MLRGIFFMSRPPLLARRGINIVRASSSFIRPLPRLQTPYLARSHFQFIVAAMSKEPWSEVGRIWKDDHAWLDDEQKAQCARAHEAGTFESPVPTQMISNGEYMPVSQSKKQKQVEERIKQLSEAASKKLGIDRRRFLASTGGMAAAFLAMNEVFGHFFNVQPIEML